MIARGVKVLSLFLGYGLVGFGGDYAVGLLAHEAPGDRAVRVRVRPDVKVDVDVPDVAVRVRMGDQGSCAYEAERKMALGASTSQWLRLQAGSGSLTVEGRDGLDQVQVVARACASDEAYLDDLQVTLEADGGDLALETHYPRRSFGGWGGHDYARLDLVVLVPRGMPLDVDDSSGEMDLSGTGALRIDDSSGGITIRGASGPVSIEDGSGGIDVADVSGDLSIDDGSGGIEVEGVQGDVRLQDGSGSIRVAAVQHDVVVENDGSGSIAVRDVQGNFRVANDGSGSIRYSGVAGRVDIPRDKRRNR
ncbi:MAG: hypothetical protein PVJ02_19740 [Gemmatimonadota bacterium]|jgi:hypothetical protein